MTRFGFKIEGGPKVLLIMPLTATLSDFPKAAGRNAFNGKGHAQSLAKDIRIKRLRIHPIKSCRGYDVVTVDYDKSV
jgi:hypothetical protein